MSQSAEILKQQFFQSLGLPCQDILPESRLNQLLAAEGISYRSRVYTPMVTLWAMVHQVLSADKSLRNTLKCMTTWLTAAGIGPPSSDTGGYSKARGRLLSGAENSKQSQAENLVTQENSMRSSQICCLRTEAQAGGGLQ